jgi:hypothetical protein
MSKIGLHNENFRRLCEEDIQLAYEEIIEKKNHSKKRKHLGEEIHAVLQAMEKEIDEIVERKS